MGKYVWNIHTMQYYASDFSEPENELELYRQHEWVFRNIILNEKVNCRLCMVFYKLWYNLHRIRYVLGVQFYEFWQAHDSYSKYRAIPSSLQFLCVPLESSYSLPTPSSVKYWSAFCSYNFPFSRLSPKCKCVDIAFQVWFLSFSIWGPFIWCFINLFYFTVR